MQTLLDAKDLGLPAEGRARPPSGDEILDRSSLSGQMGSLNSSDTLAPLLLALHAPRARVQKPAQHLVEHGGESRQSHGKLMLNLDAVSHDSAHAPVASSNILVKRSAHPMTPVFAKRRNFAFSQTIPSRVPKPNMQLETLSDSFALSKFLTYAPQPAAWAFCVPFLAPWAQDILVALALAAAAKIWIKLWSELAKREYLPSTLTRKLIHTGTGPMFVVGWAFFSNTPYARLAACAVPVINLMRLWFASRESSTSTDRSELVAALSRSGGAGEVAKGPFYYTLVLLLATAFSFRALPGAIAVCQMAVGDGLADIVGRRVGKTKWGFVKNKTIEGSAAFLIGAFAASLGMVAGANFVGYTQLTVQAAAVPLLMVSLVCTLVELFSVFIQKAVGDFADDNLTVPLVGGILSAVLLRG